jgi:hypothetical protein
VTALIAWPRLYSNEQNHRALIRWQHRLNRERPTCTERPESLLESAHGSMATVATRREEKTVNVKPPTRLTPTGLLMEGDFTH